MHLYEQAIWRLHQRGILVYGTFAFCYDADNLGSFAETADFARAQRLCLANFNPLTPTPGSPLHARLRREGRLLHKRWWLHPGYRYGQATFRPRVLFPTVFRWKPALFSRIVSAVKSWEGGLMREHICRPLNPSADRIPGDRGEGQGRHSRRACERTLDALPCPLDDDRQMGLGLFHWVTVGGAIREI